MMLSDLQTKDVIDLSQGKRIGEIVDVKIDDSGNVLELSVLKKRFLFFNSGVVTLKWKQIDKIGKDVILVREIS